MAGHSPQREEGLTLEIEARPRSGRRELSRSSDGKIRAALQSAPESGKANKELMQLVAEWLGVPKSSVEVWRGDKSRRKVLRIHGLEPAALRKAIENLPDRR
jgi:uncharacterized protein (TIGR00251 family)